jgi:hypothetical protein
VGIPIHGTIATRSTPPLGKRRADTVTARGAGIPRVSERVSLGRPAKPVRETDTAFGDPNTRERRSAAEGVRCHAFQVSVESALALLGGLEDALRPGARTW